MSERKFSIGCHVSVSGLAKQVGSGVDGFYADEKWNVTWARGENMTGCDTFLVLGVTNVFNCLYTGLDIPPEGLSGVEVYRLQPVRSPNRYYRSVVAFEDQIDEKLDVGVASLGVTGTFGTFSSVATRETEGTARAWMDWQHALGRLPTKCMCLGWVDKYDGILSSTGYGYYGSEPENYLGFISRVRLFMMQPLAGPRYRLPVPVFASSANIGIGPAEIAELGMSVYRRGLKFPTAEELRKEYDNGRG